MRKIIAAAAFVMAVAGAAPAYAQFGGSPDLQVDGDHESAGDEYRDDKFAYGDGGLDEEYGGKDEWAGADGYADDYADRGYPDPGYADDGYSAPDHPEQADAGETWQGDDGRSYCRRSDGTTGLIVGGGAGTLVGRGFDTRGERGTGTILGAIAGALLGAAVERGASCR